MRVYSYATEVDIDLAKIGTEDMLAKLSCPEAILGPVREWWQGPVPDQQRLEEWLHEQDQH